MIDLLLRNARLLFGGCDLLPGELYRCFSFFDTTSRRGSDFE